MANVTISCPKCCADYSVAKEHLGRKGHCRKCGATFVLSTAALTETRTFDSPLPDRHEDNSSGGFEAAEASEIWNVGDVILNVYEVKRLETGKDDGKHYAEGGMGLVYRVHHRGWDLDLAVKSPKSEAFGTEQGKRDFERECKTWIELGLHPNIVTCYYVRRVGGIPRVFAEFVDGGSLEDWVRTKELYEGGPAKALPRILDIAIQIGWGLHYAHERGVIHQDVKPGNVMMQGLVPKMTDFGLAKARFAAARVSPESTQASMVVSWGGMTPAYCSPEQIEAAVQAESGMPDDERTKLSRRTDIWSWALTLFAMFFGKPPCRYGGQTAPQVFEAYLERAPNDASLPKMPGSLAALLQRCFRVNPDARPQTMEEIAEELTAVYREVTGKPYPRQEPVSTELMANSLNNRAASLLDLGKQQEAAELLEEAWQRHPWQPQVTHNRGVLLWRSGRITDADLTTLLEELCKTRPRDWVAAYSLGMVQLERGEVKLAVAALEQAAALGGGEEVRTALGRAGELLPDAPRCVRSFTGKPPYVTTVHLSGGSGWALSGIDERMQRVWEVATGRSVLTLNAPPGGFSRSADGQWELSAGEDQTLRLAELTANGRTEEFRGITWGASPSAEPLSPDSRCKIAEGDHYTLELREADNGNLVQTFRGHSSSVNSVFLSDDGRWLLSGSGDKTLRLWEVATGRCMRTFKGHTDPVTGVFLCADGYWALSASSGRKLRLWNLEMLCNPDRHVVAPILLCHVTTAEEAGRAQARFSELCSSARGAANKGRLKDALELVRAARALPGYEVAKESLDLWAVVGRYCVRKRARGAWCVRTLEGHTGDVCSVFLTADGRWGLSGAGDRSVRLWQLGTGRCTRTLRGHTDWVRAVSSTPHGRRSLSGSWDRTLRLWDLAAGRCVRTFQGHTNYVNSVAISRDGHRAFSGSWDKTLKLWEIASGRCLSTFQGHDNYVNAICPSPDGRWVLSGSEDKTLRLWDVATGECLRTLEGHADWVHSVALNASGHWALSASKDRTVRLWDVITGCCQRVFEGHTGPVTAVFLSPDGRWAVSGARDNTLRLWEVASGQCQHVFEGHTDPVTSVCMSADGRWVLSGGEDHTLRLWEIDWDYEFPGWADWDRRARPFLEAFLTLLCPYAEDGLTRTGRPQWNDDDFQQLLKDLQHRGLGWLRPEGVRRELQQMAAYWQGPPPLPEE